MKTDNAKIYGFANEDAVLEWLSNALQSIESNSELLFAWCGCIHNDKKQCLYCEGLDTTPEYGLIVAKDSCKVLVSYTTVKGSKRCASNFESFKWNYMTAFSLPLPIEAYKVLLDILYDYITPRLYHQATWQAFEGN